MGIPDEIEDSFEAIMQGLAIDNQGRHIFGIVHKKPYFWGIKEDYLIPFVQNAIIYENSIF